MTERQRRTKILATLGPASSELDTIRALHAAGADVFRLNFSHGTHEPASSSGSSPCTMPPTSLP